MSTDDSITALGSLTLCRTLPKRSLIHTESHWCCVETQQGCAAGGSHRIKIAGSIVRCWVLVRSICFLLNMSDLHDQTSDMRHDWQSQFNTDNCGKAEPVSTSAWSLWYSVPKVTKQLSTATTSTAGPQRFLSTMNGKCCFCCSAELTVCFLFTICEPFVLADTNKWSNKQTNWSNLFFNSAY